LISTITQEPEELLFRYTDAYQFLEKFRIVDSAKISRFVSQKKKFENLIGQLTADMDMLLAKDLSPEQLLEKIGFAKKEKEERLLSLYSGVGVTSFAEGDVLVIGDVYGTRRTIRRKGYRLPHRCGYAGLAKRHGQTHGRHSQNPNKNGH